MSIRTPQLSEKRVREILAAGNVTTSVAILAARGYFRDSMGEKGQNDVSIHDDAWFLVAPGIFAPLQANTDPSRVGWNSSIGKPFAMLVPGLHWFIKGSHKGRTPALRQADEDQAKQFDIPNRGHFPVWRAKNMDQVIAGTAPVDVGYHAINIHDTQSDNDHSTSSWGCQTARESIFYPWMTTVWKAMDAEKQRKIPYLLVNGPLS